MLTDGTQMGVIVLRKQQRVIHRAVDKLTLRVLMGKTWREILHMLYNSLGKRRSYDAAYTQL